MRYTEANSFPREIHTMTLAILALFALGEGDPWWSLQPLRPVAPPAVRDASWGQTPVDVFLRAAQESRGLVPAAPADRLTWLRRVTFDLTGLPPSLDEQDAFVADTRPDAHERVVERLLASPAYGERWGRHWLDVARYADTHGYDKDKRRDHAWRYRDWVMGAWNADLPYTDFVRMQIAGDVLHPDRAEGAIAAGFLAAGPWDLVGQVELREGTVDKKKTRVLDRDDMVSATLGAFASLTVGCARCHDHKFDPIPTAEYYALQAVFAGVERGDRRLPESPALRTAREALAAREAQFQRELQRVHEPISRQLAQKRAALAKLPALVGPSPTNGYHSAIADRPDRTRWVQLDLGTSQRFDAVWLWPARPIDFPDTPGFGFPVRFKLEASDDPSFTREVTILSDHTAADVFNPGDTPFIVDCKPVTARYVRLTATRLWKRTGDYVLALGEMQVRAGRTLLSGKATVTALDSIEVGRWAKRHLVDGHTSRAKLPDLAALKEGQSEAARDELLREIGRLEQQRLASLTPELRRQQGELEAERRRIERQAGGEGRVYSVLPIAPRIIHVLRRGDVESPRGEAAPAALSCLSLPVSFEAKTEGERRRALADWLTHRDNVLVWRSIVNRVWHYHFGRGIVDTPNDFGKMGGKPTHPELLDWLAIDFRDSGGSFKRLHRHIVLSAAYRQSSVGSAEAQKIDGDNRLLTSMPRRRLDAESLRDATLAVSGQLRRTMGGPGYELFRFKDDHSPTYDHADLTRIHDPATYRRTGYRFVVRSVPNPFLDCLDCANPNQPVPTRNTTLTALQALAMRNNPFMVRQAQYFAERVQAEAHTPATRAERAYRLAYGTQPDAATIAALSAHAEKHGWPATCRVLLNANAFVFVD
jgi:hypothetical protein